MQAYSPFRPIWIALLPPKSVLFMEKICGIYRIFWDNNNYFYYGQALNFYRRRKSHIHAFKYKKHKNRKLQNVFNKYGIPEFEIVAICQVNELDALEQKYIDLCFNKKYCCNLSPAASSNKGVRYSEEIKIKIKETLKNWYKNNVSFNLGRKHTEESKNKNRKSHLGKRASEKTKIIMSIKKIGEKNNFYQKKHTKETIEYLKNVNLGKKYPHEINQKKSLPREKNPIAKLVINEENGIFYGCVEDAAESINIPSRRLGKYLRRERKNKTSFKFA